MKNELITIIKQAGELLKEGFYNKKEVTFKAKKDLVTQYDIGIENFLKEAFLKAFPTFNIIAEESDNDDMIFNDSIIIDPIDGTTNFVNKIPHVSISVGVYKNKEPFMGVVYNPILNELYFAQVHHGAFLNDSAIKVSTDTELMTSLISTGFPYSNGTNNDDLNDVIKKIHHVLPKCQDIRRLGSAALDLCYVAKGVYGGYYEMNLKAWDTSAGVIILQEAGGKVSNIHGEKYNIFEDKYIVASNGLIHQELLETL